eukprot:scaffold2708_cov158-Ochromonas_danica.AAC.38
MDRTALARRVDGRRSGSAPISRKGTKDPLFALTLASAMSQAAYAGIFSSSFYFVSALIFVVSCCRSCGIFGGDSCEYLACPVDSLSRPCGYACPSPPPPPLILNSSLLA